MKLKLNKKKLKNLSKDNKTLPANMTPKIAGGGTFHTLTIPSAYMACDNEVR
ncbi:hypothetical protein [Pseudoalteromonas sp. NBT06-2]|uniref:hypothetical protein n=1 Tax=Pseudoalteromonas sp. NBT06-2 TaxID=2025950 RepID=UPI00148302D3|nr:hypothetical protein [Pseudoalteromonas sp. NBT06-2]